MTLVAIPPWISVTESTSRNSRPSITASRGSSRRTVCSPSKATRIALTPSHGRAECAERPAKTTRAFRLPRQPSWSVLSVGSRHTTSAASSTSGTCSKSAGSGFSDGPSSSRGKNRKPTSYARSGAPAQRASAIMTARPPFMSRAPSPATQPSSRRPGRLPCAGTVSRWPARSTRGRPVRVAYTRVSPFANTCSQRHGAGDIFVQRRLGARLRRDVHERQRGLGELGGRVRERA